jgi:AraC family transcriptional regulator
LRSSSYANLRVGYFIGLLELHGIDKGNPWRTREILVDGPANIVVTMAAANVRPSPLGQRPLSWLRDAAVRSEPSLLHESQTAAWAGFRLGIFEATSKEVAGQHGEHAALAMILRGRTRARISSRGDRCDFSPGRDSVGLFAPSLDIAWTRWDCEPGAERMMVELDFAALALAGDLDAMVAGQRRVLRQDLTMRDGHIATLMRLIADEVRQGSPHGSLYASSLSLGLAAYLFSEKADSGAIRARERGRLTASQKSRVLDLVQLRLAEDIALNDLAAVAGIGRFHFLRLFKNTLGITPHRYLMDQRLAAARKLLEDTDQGLADVAADTGFSSQSHLCTVMRRRLGVTPAQWRRDTQK